MQSVCVLVVTYNRKDYLKKLLSDGLLKQTYELQSIIIFDNCSSDGTMEMLVEMGLVDPVEQGALSEKDYNGIRFLYYRNSANEGGSGGFHGGLKLASGLGYDYIWTMDDDVLPEADCLEKLMAQRDESHEIYLPSRSDERYTDQAIISVNMSNPFKYSIGKRKTTIPAPQLTGNTVDVVDMPFEGPLIKTSLVHKIGLPKKDLFIIFDDSEYAYRASQVTKICFVKNAILHKQIIPAVDTKKVMDWKNYYGYRNQYWFDRTYGKNVFVKYLRPVFSVADLGLRALYRRKWSNFRVLRKAYLDGTRGNLGKTVIPGTKI